MADFEFECNTRKSCFQQISLMARDDTTKSDLQAFINALVEPVMIIDRNRQIILANGVAENLFGDELVGRDMTHAVRHPNALDCVEATLNGETYSDTTLTLNLPARTTYKVTSVRLWSREGPDIVAVVRFHDITQILEAEQIRSDFVVNVSHELRSPLTALSGGIETLRNIGAKDPEAARKFLDIMGQEAARMTRLIDELLSLSKIEFREHVRPTDIVDIVSIVENAINTLEIHSEKETVRLKLDKPNSPGLVAGDADELLQVFHNLIENALKYGGSENEVQVSVSQTDIAVGINGPALEIEIRDQGNGIAQEHIPRLTERFYRVDQNRSRKIGGTGLGLSIVEHILKRHRGRLMIQSEEGVGSTFTVRLPREAPPPDFQ